MENQENLVSQFPSIDELQKEIRILKRKLSLAEINIKRASMIAVSKDRIETIWNDSLKKEHAFFKLILENTTNILLLFDFDGRFAYASDIFLTKTGLGSFGLINGRHFEDVLKSFVSEKNLLRFSESINNANIQKKTILLEDQIDFNFKEKPRTYSILITPMLDERNESTGIMALFNDITEIKAALETAKQANVAKSMFLAKMSHEIRTPMNAIIGMTELVRREDISPIVSEHIRTIEHAGTNLLSIINDILDFSKIESGKLEIIPKDYLFSSLLNDVINIIRTRVYESHLRFAVYIDNNIPNELHGDFIRLRQLMLNILSNAVKFTDQGHISLSVSGKITDSSTVVLVIEVSDTGKGIKQEDIAKLFTEFIRVDISSNMNIEGTGLGLAISHNIVKAMGGNIDVSSEYGKGSTFTVSLPQQIRNNNKIAVVENAKEKKSLIFERRELYINSIAKALDGLDVDYKISSSEEEFLNDAGSNEFQHIFISSVLYAQVKKKYKELASKAKLLVITEFGESAREQNINIISSPVFSLPIANFLNGVTNRNYYKSNYETIIGFTAPDASVLVVDDLYTNLKVAEGLMLPYCMKIDLCDSGSKAMDMLKTRRYDLVLMDHMMPGMDGIEVTEQIRALGENDDYYKKLPIIALTANAVSGIREFFLENDLNDFLPKPIDTSMLNSMLEMWIPREKQIRSTVSNNGKTIIMENNNTVDFRIKGLNINKGIMMSGGIKENYLSTLAVFHGDGKEKCNEIRNCLKTDNIKLYIIHVHALKSALYNIGCPELSETAKILETKGQQKDLIFIKSQTEPFLKDLETLLNNIDIYLKDKQLQIQFDNPDLEKIKDGLIELKTALNNCNVIQINKSTGFLQQYIRLPGVGVSIENIMQNILLGEYEKAIELIDSLFNSYR